jgi:hypothetical protein
MTKKMTKKNDYPYNVLILTERLKNQKKNANLHKFKKCDNLWFLRSKNIRGLLIIHFHTEPKPQ